jgi:uncharacterized membrane protein YqjE
MAWFLFFILIAVVFGFLGAIIKGLLWLLVVGCFVFVLALLFAGWRLRSSRSRSRT